MITDIKAHVDQIPASVLSEGDQAYPAQSKLGQLFMADWKLRLLLAGKLWKVTVGTISGSADITEITGGGAGTTIDLDLPEIAIGVGAGYYLIPVSIIVGCRVDMDANAEQGAILAAIDRTLAVPVPTASTVETPLNLLDGGGSFPGVAYSAIITTPIADPTNEELLDYVTIIGSDNGTAGNLVSNQLRMCYEPAVPSLVAGPCGLYVYWGGTAAVTGIAAVIVGAVPTSWFPVS